MGKSNRSHSLKLMFRLICVLLTVAAVYEEVGKYRQNNDKSLMKYKRFHSTSFDKYPTYTICFENLDMTNCEKMEDECNKKTCIRETKRKWELFKDEYLKNHYKIDKVQYTAMLKGEEKPEASEVALSKSDFLGLCRYRRRRRNGKKQEKKWEKFIENMKFEKPESTHNLEEIDFEKAANGVEELINSYKWTGMDGTEENISCNTNEYSNLNSNFTTKEKMTKMTITQRCPFFRSYQDSARVCLTRNLKHLETSQFYKKGRLYAYENVDLVRKNLKFNIYVHYPEQGMRTFFKRFHMKSVFNNGLTPAQTKLGTDVTFQISGIKVLRKREDGNERCNHDKKDPRDDERIFDYLFNQTGCVPPYWKRFSPKGLELPECSNASQFKNIHKMITEGKSIFNSELKEDSLAVQCDQMSYGINMDRIKNGGKEHINKPFQLRFVHLDERYLEVRNERDLGWDMCLGDIGGYMGLTLGVSLLHTTQLLCKEYLGWAKKILSKMFSNYGR